MKRNQTWRYTIYFKGDAPDLTAPVFQEYFTVEGKLDEHVIIVQSAINDVSLKDLLVKECQLSKAEFSISGGLMRLPL